MGQTIGKMCQGEIGVSEMGTNLILPSGSLGCKRCRDRS